MQMEQFNHIFFHFQSLVLNSQNQNYKDEASDQIWLEDLTMAQKTQNKKQQLNKSLHEVSRHLSLEL